MIKYNDTKSYKYSLPKEDIDLLIKETYRSSGQTLFLFQLVDGDLDKLKLLEKNIKKYHICGCPENVEEVDKILSYKKK